MLQSRYAKLVSSTTGLDNLTKPFITLHILFYCEATT